MNKRQIMSDKEARTLLGLPTTASLDKAMIDTKFHRLVREHQAKLNSALTREERETESKILILLQQAKKICLGIGGAGTQMPAHSTGTPTASTWTGMPQAAFQSKRRSYSGNGGVQNAAVKFGDIFVHLWLSVKNLFGFVMAIPFAFMEIKDFVSDVLDHIQVAGIPKIIVVLVLILGFLPLINGCIQVIHKAGWFK